MSIFNGIFNFLHFTLNSHLIVLVISSIFFNFIIRIKVYLAYYYYSAFIIYYYSFFLLSRLYLISRLEYHILSFYLHLLIFVIHFCYWLLITHFLRFSPLFVSLFSTVYLLFFLHLLYS